MEPSFKELDPKWLELAKDIAAESGEIALKYFGFDTEKTIKSDTSPLTLADTEINSLVIRRVHEAFPEHSVMGEEESKSVKDSKYLWVCDPIDGTMPYSNGMPTFTFSLALVDQITGLPVLGVVNDPVLKNMYWATKGGGAYRNGKRIFVNKETSLAQTYMNVDGSDPCVDFSNVETLLKVVKGRKAKAMSLLSVVYGGIEVANGKFSSTAFFGPYAHDVAALKIIIEEAGGKVTDLYGNERRYDEKGAGCVISNGLVHEELMACIKGEI